MLIQLQCFVNNDLVVKDNKAELEHTGGQLSTSDGSIIIKVPEVGHKTLIVSLRLQSSRSISQYTSLLQKLSLRVPSLPVVRRLSKFSQITCKRR